jgi:PRA1 family protein 1
MGGRPPMRRPGRNDNGWELQREHSWEYDRVEELTTDDDAGVELDGSYGQQRYYSDDVQTGLVRRSDMQLVYKTKEDELVQRALERIARARALGKPNVKLSRAEIDALERLERNEPPPRPSVAPKAAPKANKDGPVVKRKPVETRRDANKRSARVDSPSKAKAGDNRGRGKSSSSNNNSSSARASRDNSVAYALPPPDFGYDQRVSYPQIHSGGARQLEPSRRGSRTNSNQSLRQFPQPGQALQHPYYTQRYSSNADVQYGNRPASNSSRSSRPDPAELDWEPRARSTSSLVNVPLDQLPYQTGVGRAPRFDPADPRFASPQRRVVSGSSAVQLAPVQGYRRAQDELFLPNEPAEVFGYQVASEDEDEDNQGDEDDDSDYDAGVEVNVSERPGGYAVQTRSAAAASTSSPSRKTRGNNKSIVVKAKKGR